MGESDGAALNAASERDRLLRQRDEAWRTIAQQRQFHKDILAELDFWRRRAIELGAAETEWWAR